MAITININNLTLCHKDSGGVAIATLPDVCKTPPGPVPMPYPNIAFSKHLVKGTKTIKVDGGNMAANNGSEFSRSTGDEPGVAGGVKSGTNMKEATWLTYSFDVKLEGKGACRLTDKMLMNHGNTFCMEGVLQSDLIVEASELGVLPEVKILCNLKCLCRKTQKIPTAKGKIVERTGQWCVATMLWVADDASDNRLPLKAEVPYDNMGQPIMSKNNPRRATRGRPSGSTIPDVIIVANGADKPVVSNIKAVVEMKGTDNWMEGQALRQEKIAGKQKMILIDDKNCVCLEPGPELEVEIAWDWNVAMDLARLVSFLAALALLLKVVPHPLTKALGYALTGLLMLFNSDPDSSPDKN